MIILETERLLLRELTMDDLSEMHMILSDPVSMAYYPHPFDLEASKKWIEKNLCRYAELGFGLWAVIRKEDNLFLGDCGITMQHIMGNTVPEIGYHINRKYTNLGYGCEAAGSCLKYAFDALRFEKVYSYMKHTNAASRRVAEKIGMKFTTEYDDEVNIKEALINSQCANC